MKADVRVVLLAWRRLFFHTVLACYIKVIRTCFKNHFKMRKRKHVWVACSSNDNINVRIYSRWKSGNKIYNGAHTHRWTVPTTEYCIQLRTRFNIALNGTRWHLSYDNLRLCLGALWTNTPTHIQWLQKVSVHAYIYLFNKALSLAGPIFLQYRLFVIKVLLNDTKRSTLESD